VAALARTTERWRGFLSVALVDLAEHPEPDGVSRFAAPADGPSGDLLCIAGPWRIAYTLNPYRVLIVGIAPLYM
jgi:hypothetical protein